MVLLVLLVVFTVAFAPAQKKEGEAADPKAELLAAIARGRVLFDDPELGTSGMSCGSCHLEGGMKDGMMGDMKIKAFHKLAAHYPRYFGMAKKVMTLDQVNNWCIVNPLKGEPLKWNDQRLADLTAYVASVKAEKMEKEHEHKE
jgi:cytochrome c